MSNNNIYSILDKLNKLTPKEEPAKPVQPIYESVEARGSIVAGVKSIEQKLREQFESMGKDEMSEAAKYRDPKYKDRLYTQEPRSPEDDYYDLDYYTGAKPDDYAGSKDLIGGGEFDHNDPLQKGFGRHGHDVLDRGPRKGMPSRNHITSLKGSIKAAHGTHSEPNLPEGAEASGFYVNYEIRTGDPERVAGPFASQQQAQAWINDNVPNPSDEPYYNISQVGFNEDDMEEGAGVMHFKAQQAKADGKDSFKMGDEEFPVQEERETLKTKSGTIYKGGTYGTSYDGDDDGKKPKHVPKAGQKGRPKKDAAPTYSKSNDPFGRVPDKAPKGKKGTVVKGKGNIDTVDEEITDESKGLALHKRRGHWLATKGAQTHGYTPADKLSDRDLPNMTTDHPEAPHGQNLLKTRIKHSLGKHPAPALPEAIKNPYAIGMAQAKKETGLGTARTSGLPKKTVKRAHHIGDVIKGQMSENKRRFMTKLSEGINFTEMMRDRDRSLSELLAELQDDIKSFKDTGHCTDFLRDCLEVHGFGKKQLQDSMHPKRGDSFAPQHAEIPPAKPSFLDKAKSLGSKALDTLGHPSDDKMIQDLKRKTMDETNELNESACTCPSATCAIHGEDSHIGADEEDNQDKYSKKSVDEMYGPYDDDKVDAINAANPPKTPSPVSSRDPGRIGGPAIPVKHHTYDRKSVASNISGKDSAAYDYREQVEQGGMEESETCPTCHSEPCACDSIGKNSRYDDHERSMGSDNYYDDDAMDEAADRELAKLKENCGILSPIAGGAQQMQSAEEQRGNLSVNTSADNKGHKTITITADGEEAEKLSELIKLAGLGGGHQPQVHQAEIVVAQEAKKYGDTDVEEPEEVLNTPRPDLQGMHRSPTTGLNKATDDLHKSKSQHPTAAAKGDNPLTKKEKTIEDFNPIDQLGAQLMAEYQSIKLQK